MRQTQILRVHKRRVVDQAAPVSLPTMPAADTTAAATLLETLDTLLAEATTRCG